MNESVRRCPAAGDVPPRARLAALPRGGEPGDGGAELLQAGAVLLRPGTSLNPPLPSSSALLLCLIGWLIDWLAVRAVLCCALLSGCPAALWRPCSVLLSGCAAALWLCSTRIRTMDRRDHQLTTPTLSPKKTRNTHNTGRLRVLPQLGAPVRQPLQEDAGRAEGRPLLRAAARPRRRRRGALHEPPRQALRPLDWGPPRVLDRHRRRHARAGAPGLEGASVPAACGTCGHTKKTTTGRTRTGQGAC